MTIAQRAVGGRQGPTDLLPGAAGRAPVLSAGRRPASPYVSAPTAPIDSTDPPEPIERIESSDHSDNLPRGARRIA